ncbi:hypothetical protein MRBLMN1_003149 [Chitinophaga ginsengisegetis]|uniref:RHS repeat-associated core domain-containing protein n=1 Tax=Chitinophaga ginsengisegetis TaxID=393003 RepID=UPI0034167CBA
MGVYRYGFNGKENDNEIKGEGNQQDYGMRVYDPRIGKFLSVDPLTQEYPWYTPYQFAGNKPIWAVDLDGAEEKTMTGAAFNFVFGSPGGYLHPRTALDHLSNERMRTQRTAYNSSLLFAPHFAYYTSGGDELYAKQDSWDNLGREVVMKDMRPNNIVNINATPSAREHNEAVSTLNKQFLINEGVSGSETGLVNLLLGSYFRGNAPENIIFPTNGYGSNFLRNSPQVDQALSNFVNMGRLSGKVATPSVVSSLSNMFSGNFKLQDFIGSVDYSITEKDNMLTLTMTNVTSITSGTFGKEFFGSKNWPRGILRNQQMGTNSNSNFSQTFSLTFPTNDVVGKYYIPEK